MTASTGTTRGGTLFGAAAALAVAAGGAVAALAPVHDTVWPDGPVLLIEWVLLAAVAVWCAELAVARAAKTRTYTNSDEPRALRLGATGLLATALTAELTLITARCAEGHAYGMAWASGGVLLALFTGATWRLFVLSDEHGSGHTPSDNLLVGAAFVLAEACGAWLTARFAVEGPLWAAWALGCAMVALAAGFWLSDSQYWQADSTYVKVFGSAAVLGVAGVVAHSAVRGETVAAWWVGIAAVGVPLLGTGVLSLWGILTSPRASGGRGRTTSPGAQFAGVLVPVASLAWAAWDDEPWSGQGLGGGRLLDASYLTVAGAALLLAQSVVLAWMRPGPPRHVAAELVHEVRRLAAEEVSRPRSSYHLDPSGRSYRDPYYERELGRERDEARDRFLARLHDRRLNGSDTPTAAQHLTHPLQSATVLTIHRRTALDTGLAIDEIWPRIGLVAPAEVTRQVRRRERGVAAWRIVVASAVCTAGVWLLVALTGLGGFRLEGAWPALLVAGPLLVAAFAVMQARRLLVEEYKEKADAVEVFRYDLAKRLHLAPEGPLDMIRMAAELSDDRAPYPYPGSRPPRRPVENPEFGAGARPDRLAAEVAALVRDDIRADVRQAVRDEYASLTRQNPARTELAAPDLVQLARDIAESAAEPVSTHLKSHLTDLQQKFHQDVRATIRSSLDESVTGAPLTNFVGYLAIELDRSAQEGGEQPPVRAEGGTIKAPAGRRVDLVVSVVRDPRAQTLASVVASRPGTDFFVFEPVRVEGGRDAETVSFDAMADSSTLTPLPQRKNLLVTDEKQTAFGFRLPAEAGSHEVWIQLYQAAHLVQVVALKIEAEAAPPAPGPGEETEEATGAAMGEATDEATVEE
ncbi:hypothetical protein [Streptomyces sp. NPDC050982]|uniref:hypothetical protein n=1 Tax=Streptomyces sp. NPDC050982 TaxID=3154746 RepID=UPI003409537A